MRLIFLATCLLAGCTTTPEIRFGCGPRHVQQPSNSQTEGACEVAVMQRFGEHGYCEIQHASEPQDGPTGNRSEPDVAVNQGMCGIAWGGKRR